MPYTKSFNIKGEKGDPGDTANLIVPTSLLTLNGSMTVPFELMPSGYPPTNAVGTITRTSAYANPDCILFLQGFISGVTLSFRFPEEWNLEGMKSALLLSHESNGILATDANRTVKSEENVLSIIPGSNSPYGSFTLFATLRSTLPAIQTE